MAGWSFPTVFLIKTNDFQAKKLTSSSMPIGACKFGDYELDSFRYADRSNLYFNCQIRITIKEPGQECARPTCPEPARRKRGAKVVRRNRRQEAAAGDLIVDVSYKNPILVGDVDLTESGTASYHS
jgi:hypothetical protein